MHDDRVLLRFRVDFGIDADVVALDLTWAADTAAADGRDKSAVMHTKR